MNGETYPWMNQEGPNMDWSKIKTIFILTFLVLDIYLMYEFFKLKDSSQFEFITEASFEKRLKADEIEYPDLPKNNQKDKYLSAKSKIFTNEEIEEVEETKLEGQKITVTDSTLQSVLEKPFKISESFEPAELNSFIKNKVLYGDQYRFWEKSKKGNTITYYQQYEEKIFFKNINGELTFYLNEENEIVSYRQTLLEDIEGLSENEKIIQPLKVIENLYENGSLKPKSQIIKMEPGYYTFVQLSGSQVLTPAWRLVFKDKEDLFVHAIEGQIIELNNEEKIKVE